MEHAEQAANPVLVERVLPCLQNALSQHLCERFAAQLKDEPVGEVVSGFEIRLVLRDAGKPGFELPPPEGLWQPDATAFADEWKDSRAEPIDKRHAVGK